MKASAALRPPGRAFWRCAVTPPFIVLHIPFTVAVTFHYLPSMARPQPSCALQTHARGTARWRARLLHVLRRLPLWIVDVDIWPRLHAIHCFRCTCRQQRDAFKNNARHIIQRGFMDAAHPTRCRTLQSTTTVWNGFAHGRASTYRVTNATTHLLPTLPAGGAPTASSAYPFNTYTVAAHLPAPACPATHHTKA